MFRGYQSYHFLKNVLKKVTSKSLLFITILMKKLPKLLGYYLYIYIKK